jgi:hypothetical protein
MTFGMVACHSKLRSILNVTRELRGGVTIEVAFGGHIG